MLRSMTGYGDATVETEDFALSIDARTFNNRFLKLNAKIPDEIIYLQNDLEEMIRSRLTRGSVFYTVRFQPTRPADLYDVDHEVVRKYADSIRALSEEFGAQGFTTNTDIRVQELLLLPGAVTGEEALRLGRELVEPAARDAMSQTLDAVVQMRETEGRNLTADLKERRQGLIEHLESVKAESPAALQEHYKKLEEKVRKLLGEQESILAPEDIVKEAAILAERADVSEEVARLGSHLDQFDESLESDAPVGRKLEFIVQEMLRESNTMGAKVANNALSRHVVEIKAEVDRLKEQVLNIQ